MGQGMQRGVAIVLVVALVLTSVWVGGNVLGPIGVVVFAVVGAVVAWLLFRNPPSES